MKKFFLPKILLGPHGWCWRCENITV